MPVGVENPFEVSHRLASLDIPEAAANPCRGADDLLDRVARWGDRQGRYYSSPHLLRRLAQREEVTTIRAWRDELVRAGEATLQPAGRNCYGGGVVWVMQPERRTRWSRFSKRRSIPAVTRREVFARDDYACRYCGRRSDLAVDHVIPWSLGGPDDLSNLQTLCRSCNSRKGARLDALVQG